MMELTRACWAPVSRPYGGWQREPNTAIARGVLKQWPAAAKMLLRACQSCSQLCAQAGTGTCTAAAAIAARTYRLQHDGMGTVPRTTAVRPFASPGRSAL